MTNLPIIRLKLSLLMVFVFVLIGCKKEPVADPMNGMMGGPMPVTVMQPVKRSVTEWLEFTGRFQPSQRVVLRARVSGYLDKILFQDGQKVQKGDVLFIIDQRPFKIALNSAKAHFELAQQRLERAKALHKKNAVSRDLYDQRQEEMQTARADLDRAKLDLEFTEIRSPITGRISRKQVDVGNLVAGGNNATELTTIVSVQPIYFYFEGSENDLLKNARQRDHSRSEDNMPRPLPVFVRLNDEVEFQHQGQLDFIDNEFDTNTGTIQARAYFENSDGFLEAGYFGRLRLAPFPAFDAMLVPDELIGTEQTRKFVYVVNKEGVAARRYISLGAREDDGMRIIKQGLNETDQVITGNLNMVRPGAPVMVVPSKKPVEATSQDLQSDGREAGA